METRDYAYVIFATIYLVLVVGWCFYGPFPIHIHKDTPIEVTE